MRVRKEGRFYTERKPYESPVITEDKEAEWWIASDIQREIARRYGKYIGLPTIGAIAKRFGLVRKTSFGFNLYHKSLVDIIGGDKQ